jgi:hypothetical protein
MNEKSYVNAAIGGFIGAIITHPIDSLKTWYQYQNNSLYPKHWSFRNYYNGWYIRAIISLISMNIGWIIFYNINNFMK